MMLLYSILFTAVLAQNGTRSSTQAAQTTPATQATPAVVATARNATTTRGIGAGSSVSSAPRGPEPVAASAIQVINNSGGSQLQLQAVQIGGLLMVLLAL